MSNKTNHRREKNKAKVDRRYEHDTYHNGYARTQSDDRYRDGELMNPDGVDETQDQGRVGRTGYLDKSMHGWSRKSQLADMTIGASIGNDFSNGHRGMARAVKGAKKFVRTRIRFHENAAVRNIVNNLDEEMS
jgi:hypothetical protein